MKYPLSILLALLWLASAQSQTVNPQTIIPVSIHGSSSIARPGCPQGVSLPDGCLGSPGGTVQHANFFTGYANQSGQSYSTRPPWNLCGVDYTCGAPSLSALKDPTLASNWTGSGCVYTASGGPVGAFVRCSSHANIVISGFDFSCTIVSCNSPACIPIQLQGTVTGTTIVSDNYWKNGANCSPSANGYFIDQESGGSASLIVESNTFDGNETNFPNPMIGLVTVNTTTGSFTSEYNAYLNAPARPLGYVGTGGFLSQYDYFDGYVFLPVHGHGEIAVVSANGGNLATVTYRYDTVLQPTTACACSTTTIFTSDAASPSDTWALVTADHNLEVVNITGGAATVPGTVTGTIDNGLGTGPGNTFTETVTGTGTIGSGVALNGTGLVVTAHLAGSGVGSTWSVMCTSTGAPCAGGSPATIANTTPSIQIAATVYTMLANVTGPVGSEVSHSTFTQINFTNSYLDKIGGNSYWEAITGAVCTNPTTFSGNIDLITGASANGYTTTTGGC